MNVRFLKTAVLPQDWPEANLPEVAMVGRSNAGKSTLINGLTVSKTAKVSSSPGKTRALNFFDVNGKYRLVDMPGYGFAARSGAEVKSWQEMVENFLSIRASLVGLILVMDIRRPWTEDEQMICDLMDRTGRPVLVALTKCDKVGNNEKRNIERKMKAQLGVEKVMAVSGARRMGTKELEEYIFQKWVTTYSQWEESGELK